MASKRFSTPAPGALRSVVRDSGRRARRGHAAHCHRGPRRRYRPSSRCPAAGCSGRGGGGTAEHLLLQPRRPPRRLPRSDRPAAVHAQDPAWMAGGRRYTQMFVADPSCCPSRSSLMTGRYPHNNGVHNQQDGPLFDGPHSMACYLRTAGYATYLDGKFLTTWPKTTLPPCFDHSTVMWGGYSNVQVQDRREVARRHRLLHDVPRQRRVGPTSRSALSGTKPFLLYETPQAPHWVDVTPERHHRRSSPSRTPQYAIGERRDLLRRPRGRPVRQAGLRAQR